MIDESHISIVFTVVNRSGSSIPFAFAVVAADPGNEENGTLLGRFQTAESFPPGHIVKHTLPWRFDKISPFDCVWKPLPGFAKKWFVKEVVQHGGAEHGRHLVAPPGGWFE